MVTLMPKILLVDEPTSSLDPKIGAEIMDLMASIAQEEHVPMLISVHDLKIARTYSSRIVGLHGGTKVLDVVTVARAPTTTENIYHAPAEAFLGAAA